MKKKIHRTMTPREAATYLLPDQSTPREIYNVSKKLTAAARYFKAKKEEYDWYGIPGIQTETGRWRFKVDDVDRWGHRFGYLLEVKCG